MIPLQLTLKNFLSYGSQPQTLSFERHRLLFLSGKNGHGKSALLDALSWALWGAARKQSNSARADEGVMHSGSTHMYVMYTFLLDGKKYQVRREVLKERGKTTVSLDFSLFDETIAQYRSLTDKTIRQTQERINDVIGIDYETYCNSVFLRQGNSDQFSRKSPKERKEILGAILGLGAYEKLHQKAGEKTRELDQELALIDQMRARYTESLAELSVIEQAQLALQTELETLDTESRLCQDSLARDTQRVEELKILREKEIFFGANTTAFIAESREWRRDLEKNRTIGLISRDELKSELAQAEEFSQKLHNEVDELNRLERRREQLAVELLSREHEIINAHARRLAEVQEAFITAETGRVAAQKRVIEERTRIEHLEKEKIVVCQAQQQAEMLYEDYQKRVVELVPLKGQFEKRKLFYATYKNKNNGLEERLKEYAAQRKSLIASDSPACTVCKQSLTPELCSDVLTQLAREENFIRHMQERLVRLLGRLKELLIVQHAELETASRELEKGKALSAAFERERARREQIERALSEYTLKFEQLIEEEKKLSERAERAEVQCGEIAAENQQLKASDTVLQALETEREGILTRINHLLPSRALLTATTQKISELRASLSSLDRGAEERASLVHRRLSLSRQYRLLTRERDELHARAERLSMSRDALASELEMSLKAVEKTTELTQLCNLKYQSLWREQGRLKEKEEALAAVQVKLAALENERLVKQSARIQFDFCVKAWSKNGIPALLIEEALPELEYGANELLGRLTNNTAQIFIESLRDLKKGGIRETLDIKISDASGVRPYELFSGGEAFRIDFALRIALSQLLARRAGTSLQMLVIDEGFGSQDEEGLQLLLDVLTAIQSDFEKIIVVSHLPALKEHFPVHVCVEKKPSGSVITLDERG